MEDSGRPRIHTTFNMTVAQTGRLSSVDPNLQNIPVRTDLGKRIRTAFLPSPGKVLISADYAQQELRVAAALAGDEALIEAFNKDEDIHKLTAADVFGVKPEDVTREQRYAAKTVNFGVLYGQGPHGLAQGTGMSFGEAKQFIEKYFAVRPKIKAYLEHLREMAKNKAMLRLFMVEGVRRQMCSLVTLWCAKALTVQP